jgi:hypothetical protein
LFSNFLFQIQIDMSHPSKKNQDGLGDSFIWDVIAP